MSSRWVGMLEGMFGLSSWWVGMLLNGVLGVSSWWVGTLDGMLCVSCRQVGVALHQTSATLDHLDKHLFALDLDRCLDENSSEQTPWINLVTPTARQAKAEACDHLRHAQRNIREFVLRPVLAGPPPPVAQPKRLPTPGLAEVCILHFASAIASSFYELSPSHFERLHWSTFPG
jgi:hypothetical protein